MGPGMVGGMAQRAVQGGLGGVEMRVDVIGHERRSHGHFDLSRGDRRFDVPGIERQGSREEIPCLRQQRSCHAPVLQGSALEIKIHGVRMG